MYNRNHLRDMGYELQGNMGGIAVGLLIGVLAGAVTMLFIAPQTGKRMRALVRNKAYELRDQATDAAEEVIWQARSKTRHLGRGARATAKDLQHRGQDAIDRQRERVEDALEAGQRAVSGKFR